MTEILEQKTEKPDWKQWLPCWGGLLKMLIDTRNKKPTILESALKSEKHPVAKYFGIIGYQTVSMLLPYVYSYFRFKDVLNLNI